MLDIDPLRWNARWYQLPTGQRYHPGSTQELEVTMGNNKKHLRRILAIGMTCAFGVILALNDISFTTPTFWVLLFTVLAYGLINFVMGLDEGAGIATKYGHRDALRDAELQRFQKQIALYS